MSRVCQLTKGGSTLTVMDAGNQIFGSAVCSGSEQAGWAASGP